MKDMEVLHTIQQDRFPGFILTDHRGPLYNDLVKMTDDGLSIRVHEVDFPQPNLVFKIKTKEHKLSNDVATQLTDLKRNIFPEPNQVFMECKEYKGVKENIMKNSKRNLIVTNGSFKNRQIQNKSAVENILKSRNPALDLSQYLIRDDVKVSNDSKDNQPGLKRNGLPVMDFSQYLIERSNNVLSEAEKESKNIQTGATNQLTEAQKSYSSSTQIVKDILTQLLHDLCVPAGINDVKSTVTSGTKSSRLQTFRQTLRELKRRITRPFTACFSTRN